MKTSADASRSSSRSRSSGRRRFNTTLRLPRLSREKAGFGMSLSIPSEPNTWRMGSPAGGSIFMTSAPQSASSAAAEGAATQPPSSITRRSENVESPDSVSGLTRSRPVAARGGPRPQHVLEHLSSGVDRQLVDELHDPRDLVV